MINSNLEKDELIKQNAELKELLLKLNQDKQMFEKKVQRKTSELSKLKQSYEVMQDKLLTQKGLVTDPNQSENDDQILISIIDQLILYKLRIESQQTQQVQQQNQQYNSQQYCGEQCENEKKNLNQQIVQIQEQQRLDLVYYSKKIKQNEELLVDIKGKYESQLQELNEANAILKAKLEFLVGKANFYHEVLNDMSNQVSEIHQLRILNQENQKKADEDLIGKNTQKIAQLEVRNGFLVEQVKNMEQELIGLEKLVTNIEQLTMQTKKRGK